MGKVPMSNVYDSNIKLNALSQSVSIPWRNVSLISLLVKREISVRYKRSFIGLFWTLINPLLTALVLWVVFVHVFTSRLANGTEFAPYVLSGVLLMTLFIQGCHQVADTLVVNSEVLTKIRVFPQVFAIAAGISNAIHFCLGLVALALVSFLIGSGLSITFPLAGIVVLSMLFTIIGTGMFLSIMYVWFEDARSIFSIFFSFSIYLTPVFYPIEILNPRISLVVNSNPLTSHLQIFRDVFLNIGSATLFDWMFMVCSSVGIFFAGSVFFTKNWPRTVVML